MYPCARHDFDMDCDGRPERVRPSSHPIGDADRARLASVPLRAAALPLSGANDAYPVDVRVLRGHWIARPASDGMAWHRAIAAVRRPRSAMALRDLRHCRGDWDRPVFL